MSFKFLQFTLCLVSKILLQINTTQRNLIYSQLNKNHLWKIIWNCARRFSEDFQNSVYRFPAHRKINMALRNLRKGNLRNIFVIFFVEIMLVVSEVKILKAFHNLVILWKQVPLSVSHGFRDPMVWRNSTKGHHRKISVKIFWGEKFSILFLWLPQQPEFWMEPLDIKKLNNIRLRNIPVKFGKN